ncbi:transcription factor TFIIIC subunit tfc4, partial [Coemansia helicoidea]
YCAVGKRLLADWRRIRAFYLAERARPFQTYRNIVLTNLERDAQSGELGPLAEASGQAAMRRQLDRMKRRLARQQRPQDDEDAGARPTTFRGHSFNRWFDMFLEYAKCLALDRRPAEALDVLDVISQSSVFFHDARQSRTLHLMMLAVALNAGAVDRLYELMRWWCGSRPTTAARYRLLAFAMATSASAAAVLTSGNVYKYVRRLLAQLDALYYREHGPREPLARDRPALQTADHEDADADQRPVTAGGLTRADVAALHSVAAHIMLVSRVGSTHLAQYTMALALVPQDASAALHLGVAYLVHATKRDVASPQAMALRGLTYVQRYAELRCIQERRAAARPLPPAQPDYVVTQEIAYNLARAFHLVGLLDLAAAYYARVFGLPVTLAAGDDPADRAFSHLRSDAAYNLASIYVVSGSPLRARALLAEHCTI